MPIDDETLAIDAAQIRARYNLQLPDAFQIAVALAAGCDAFLTNDVTFRRVTELRILVSDELEVVESTRIFKAFECGALTQCNAPYC